ncbi:hypothetical protein ADIS_0223 [Lunatimonas lonarensis]|uniref:Uncharacterized protein n=1 Tax=Lunatimonas lonarensis TaxID=1232681 RepID=R7ZZ27_9BACT|nr:hypothetical protein [Lunatimonas lonarensis]EON79298.1 hypothetical protein ADIS_0223 [Lunatimonas lonarensis]
MKLLDYLILPAAAALVIIGAHLTMTQGIGAAYPVLMFAVALLFWFMYRKRLRAEDVDKPETTNTKKKKSRR